MSQLISEYLGLLSPQKFRSPKQGAWGILSQELGADATRWWLKTSRPSPTQNQKRRLPLLGRSVGSESRGPRFCSPLSLIDILMSVDPYAIDKVSAVDLTLSGFHLETTFDWNGHFPNINLMISGWCITKMCENRHRKPSPSLTDMGGLSRM